MACNHPLTIFHPNQDHSHRNNPLTDLPNAQEVWNTIKTMQQPLLLSHQRPDGDALGSLIAMDTMLTLAGKTPIVCVFDEIPTRYTWLTGSDMTIGWDESTADESDGVIIMDTCSCNQLAPAANWLKTVKTNATKPIIAIDHHVTRDPLADIEMVDTSASAACIILHEWAKCVGLKRDSRVVTALFVGIATDTGWFRFSNADARAHRAAADLLESQIEPDRIYRRIYESESPNRFKLRAAALTATELHDDGRIAIMPITEEMFTRTGTTHLDTEDIVNDALRMSDVQVAVLMVEQKSDDQQIIKMSLRSKGRVDVAAVAQRLGGGGHKVAAGARVTGSMIAARETILAELDINNE